MTADFLSIAVRALSFIALFQAAGIALFLTCVVRSASFDAAGRVRRLGMTTAGAGMVLVLAHYLLEAARMAGDLAGVLDPSLQTLVMQSSSSAALGLRLVGLGVLLVSFRMVGITAMRVSLVGVVLALAGFLAVGHTSTHSPRTMLALLLFLHLVVVAFWFGGLVPLHLTAKRETPGTAAQIVERFSSLAIWLVPGLFVAGVVLAAMILPNLAALGTAYGQLLILKVVGFSLLLGLASINKWRLAPALARGDQSAQRFFSRSVAAEWVIIAAVLCITAAMTALFSPEG